MKNLLTDISGVLVGHADDATLASGATAVIFDKPVVAAIDVRGGGPGTREAALLELANTVERVMGVLMVITAIGYLTDSVSTASIWLLETFPALQSLG